jgi:hypothetical protein
VDVVAIPMLQMCLVAASDRHFRDAFGEEPAVARPISLDPPTIAALRFSSVTIASSFVVPLFRTLNRSLVA